MSAKTADRAGSPPEPEVTLPDLGVTEPKQPEPSNEPEPPAEPDNTPRSDEPMDFTKFEPEDMNKPKEEPEPEPYDPVPEVKPKEDEPTTPDPTKAERNDFLRQSLKEAKAAEKAAQEELAKLKAAQEEHEASVREELEAARKKAEELASQSLQPQGEVNPWESEEVVAITKPWEQRIQALANSLDIASGSGDMLRGDNLNNLMKMFGAVGSPDSDGYQERREAVSEHLETHFPEDKRTVSELMLNGLDVWGQAAEKAQAIESDKTSYLFKAQQEAHKKAVEVYKAEIEASYGDVPDELKESQPTHPEVVIDRVLEGDSAFKDKMQQTKKFLRYAQNEMAPITQEELSHFDTVEEQQQYAAQRQAQHSAARKQLQQQQYKWAAAYQLVPSLTREIADLKERLSSYEAATPDAPKSKEKPPTDDVQEVKDWAAFEPTPISSPY